MKFITAFLFLTLAAGTTAFAQQNPARTYEELPFLQEFAGKDADYIQAKLGEPASIVKKENAGGSVEFWIYRDLVRQGSSDKVYRFTQIGIVNDAVETLGHTNRQPQ